MKPIPVHGQGTWKSLALIMVVDEDDAMRALLADALQEKGCRVVESQDGKDALDTVKRVKPHVIVTDLKIPNGGYPYLQLLKGSSPESSIVVMTAHVDSQSKSKALEHGATQYFEKPLHIKHLKSFISQICLINPCGNIS